MIAPAGSKVAENDFINGLLSHWVAFDYDFAGDPTLVTCIREMPAGTGGSESVTLLEYYEEADNVLGQMMASGQLKAVTDSNGSRHEFSYDARGFASQLESGIPDDPAGCSQERTARGGSSDGALVNISSNDTGAPTGGSGSGGGESTNQYEGDGCPKWSECEAAASFTLGSGYLERFGIMPPDQPRVKPLLQCVSGFQYRYAGRPGGAEMCIDRQETEEGYDLTEYDHEMDYYGPSTCGCPTSTRDGPAAPGASPAPTRSATTAPAIQ